MKSARIYDFTIPANGSFQLNVEGDYVRIMDAAGSVEIVTDSMRLGPLKAGQGQADTPFKRLTLNDKSGAGNRGTVLVASSGFIDQRINGEVSVIDGGKARTFSNMAFIASLNITSDGTSPPCAYLHNPSGSGKNIILQGFRASFGTTQSWGLGWSAGVTGVDESANGIVSKSNTGVFKSKIYSHLSGATAANVKYWIASGFASANATDTIKFTEPVVIVPNAQIKMTGSYLASSLIIQIEAFEEAI